VNILSVFVSDLDSATATLQIHTVGKTETKFKPPLYPANQSTCSANKLNPQSN